MDEAVGWATPVRTGFGFVEHEPTAIAIAAESRLTDSARANARAKLDRADGRL